MRAISRDPFARTELHRVRDYDVSHHGCKWCGQIKTTPKGRWFLYRYETQHDAGRHDYIDGRYCSVDCMRAYYS